MPERASRITFRPLEDGDIPALSRWLQDPDVAPWYAEGTTDPEELRAQYREEIAGTGPTRAFIIRIDGRDVGYIQAYRIEDEPDYARQMEVDPGAVGIDLFIGEAEARDRGWGSRVLRAFLAQVVFGEMAAPVAIIAPSPDNARAVRSYERAGFVWQKTVYIDTPGEPWNTGEEYVMRLTREAFEQGGEA